MSRRSTVLIGLFATIVAILAGFYGLSQRLSAIQQTTPASATTAMELFFASALDDARGQRQAFSQWQGKTLVVNFWATWCPPCLEEIPSFSRLQASYAAKGVQFVGIALDSLERVGAFSEHQAVSYPLLIGGVQGVELAQQFGNASLALPYTVVIGPERDVRLVRMGPLSEVELDRFLRITTSR